MCRYVIALINDNETRYHYRNPQTSARHIESATFFRNIDYARKAIEKFEYYKLYKSVKIIKVINPTQ